VVTLIGFGITADRHDLLVSGPEPQFGNVEQPVDDVISATDPVVDELGLALAPPDEQWRRLPDGQTGREGDERLATVVETRRYSPPTCSTAIPTPATPSIF
jgi:hypothetical protein